MESTDGGVPISVPDLVRRVLETGPVLLEADGVRIVCLTYEQFSRRQGPNPAPADVLLPSPTTALSAREEQVLEHISQGLSAFEVSHVMGIAVSSTSQHLLAVRRKFGVHSTREAVRRWRAFREPGAPGT